ncbi:ATP-dependent zinc metalloprotease FtsH [Candidatus Nitrospira inopinata]|uniref:ATP-dependent zinc metalloprotease FtsH n=1 Tax=Candidatus Nitrospira inopinata TaxID=1715989 RepID=A0A0S4KPD8_9BACT|nr:ATP-dependent zinc metalloprotease FtsH [Candidatus Nitrospira inopinata]CUQ65631.1 ATP-dependent zinc metalloprotease FtsH [Candidatus Nitrospira inopinata]
MGPKGGVPPMNNKVSFSIWYIFLAIMAVVLVHDLIVAMNKVEEVPYSQFKKWVEEGKVAEVAVTSHMLTGKLKPEGEEKVGQLFATVRVEDPDLVRELNTHGVVFTGVIETTFWRDLLSWIVPVALFVGIWMFILRRMGQAQGGFMQVGQSKAKIYMEKDIKVRFSDVAGVDEAKEELREVIEFLKTPEKFTKLGGKIPKGILLVGPPGTGKTLLAKAVAGEAGVPFFSISGSEFVEMFVGVGAARVRDLFEQAKTKAPCIIFIDELDALGKARGMGPMTHEEREQTLNQLLVEMDGFDPRVGVILMAATNRPEILDPALLRAGRFDRHVTVDRPDKLGRLAILRVHAKQVALGADADLETVAAMTPGFSGADLANVINEAALLSVRRGKDKVGASELQEAVERVIAGLEKKNRVLNKMEKERVAYHETGHALVALSVPGADQVQKISIIPRGVAALGYTLQLPTEDRFLMTKSELENKIAVLLGGRIAEELTFGEASTGAQNDLVKATDIAKSMVKAYGMSDKLGTIALERDRQPQFLQISVGSEKGDYSEQTAREIDCEVRRIVDEQYERVKRLLESKKAALQQGAKLLLEREVISGPDLQAIMEKT